MDTRDFSTPLGYRPAMDKAKAPQPPVSAHHSAPRWSHAIPNNSDEMTHAPIPPPSVNQDDALPSTASEIPSGGLPPISTSHLVEPLLPQDGQLPTFVDLVEWYNKQNVQASIITSPQSLPDHHHNFSMSESGPVTLPPVSSICPDGYALPTDYSRQYGQTSNIPDGYTTAPSYSPHSNSPYGAQSINPVEIQFHHYVPPHLRSSQRPVAELNLERHARHHSQPPETPAPILPPVQNWTVTPTRAHTKSQSISNSAGPDHSTLGNRSSIPVNIGPSSNNVEVLNLESRQKQEVKSSNDEVSRKIRHNDGEPSKLNHANGRDTGSRSMESSHRGAKAGKPRKPASGRGTKRQASPTPLPQPAAPLLRHIQNAHALGITLPNSPYSTTLTRMQGAHFQGYHASSPAPGSQSRPMQTSSSSAAPPKPFNRDEDFKQAIVPDYEKYKWSVKLYKVNAEKTGSEFALFWLEDQLATLDFEYRYKWLVHKTDGFIQDGDHLTFLVLHNAAYPFEYYDHDSSTSFGYLESSTSSITWKTIAPGLRSMIKACEADGSITEVAKWAPDMKASDKRFHRAYWRAANMLPLQNLLNRGERDDSHIKLPYPTPEKPKFWGGRNNSEQWDVMDIDDEPRSDSDSDMDLDIENSGIDIPSDEAEKSWQQVLEELRAGESVYHTENVAIGNSEWAPL